MSNVLEIIQARHSERGPFDPARPVAREDLGAILEAARWAPTPLNMQNFEILLVDDKELLESIERFRSDASEAFLRESYAQLSFSEEELLAKKTGLLASMFPPAWTDPEAWHPDSDSRSQLAFVSTWMPQTPMLLLILHDAGKRAPGSEGDALGNIGLGCVVENMWLMSEFLGVGFQVLSAFSDPRVERQMRGLLGVPDRMKIDLACRLGYPIESTHNSVRVRRRVEAFCHHNSFGSKPPMFDEDEFLPGSEHELNRATRRVSSLGAELKMPQSKPKPYAELRNSPVQVHDVAAGEEKPA